MLLRQVHCDASGVDSAAGCDDSTLQPWRGVHSGDAGILISAMNAARGRYRQYRILVLTEQGAEREGGWHSRIGMCPSSSERWTTNRRSRDAPSAPTQPAGRSGGSPQQSPSPLCSASALRLRTQRCSAFWPCGSEPRWGSRLGPAPPCVTTCSRCPWDGGCSPVSRGRPMTRQQGTSALDGIGPTSLCDWSPVAAPGSAVLLIARFYAVEVMALQHYVVLSAAIQAAAW